MKAIANPARLAEDPPDDPEPTFRDRTDAGQRLSGLLTRYAGRHPLVFGLARGGVPVAAAVARALGGELDVLVVRKLGSPISDELAIGAVTSDGGRVLNMPLVSDLMVSKAYIENVTRVRTLEAEEMAKRLRAGLPTPDIAGRVTILCDDGLATGASMLAAVRAVRAQRPSHLVVAVPVASREACAMLRMEADEVVCVASPDPFWAVGVYYADFSQVETEDVQRLLREARVAPSPAVRAQVRVTSPT
jgi:putative phosphoribosyl transferase